MERITIHPDNPQERLIKKAADLLHRSDGICIYPTDTVYGVGCAVGNTKALKKIAHILHRDEERLFSFICESFAQAEQYAQIDTPAFKLMKRYLPGPFTFILPATKFVQKKINPKRKTVGIRIVDSTTTNALLSYFGEPLANMSLNTAGENRGDPDLFMTPEVISGVDVMVDTGALDDPRGSTIIDLTGDEPLVLRDEKGLWNE